MRWPGGGSARAAGRRAAASGAASARMASRSSERGHDVGEAVDEGLERGVLARLDQAEVPLGQRHLGVAVHGADDRQAERARSASRTSASCRALATWFRIDAGDAHLRVVGGEAAGDGGGGLRLAGDVEHQQHRQAVAAREVGGGAAAARRGRDAVEEAHGALDHQHVGARRLAARRGGRAAPAASPSCRG